MYELVCSKDKCASNNDNVHFAPDGILSLVNIANLTFLTPKQCGWLLYNRASLAPSGRPRFGAASAKTTCSTLHALVFHGNVWRSTLAARLLPDTLLGV